MLRECQQSDFARMYRIINEAAKDYAGVIPADRYHQPYMPREELEEELGRMTFFGWDENDLLVGVMGYQPVNDVTLIRHAYILPRWQNRAIGSNLLKHIFTMVITPRLLVGTWADAGWAVAFYKKHGFKVERDKNKLLKTYWDIPQRQVDTSVVLGIEMTKEL